MSELKWLLENLLGSETLTEWEYEFVNSLATQYEIMEEITYKQKGMLEEIYQEDSIRKKEHNLCIE